MKTMVQVWDDEAMDLADRYVLYWYLSVDTGLMHGNDRHPAIMDWP